MKRNILVICNAPFMSGAEFNLAQFLNVCNNEKYEFTLAVSKKELSLFNSLPKKKYLFLQMPFIWFHYSLNPIYLLKCLFNSIYCTFLMHNVLHNKIDLVYANSTKSNIYGVLFKLVFGKKLIWHVRDNLTKGLLNNILIKFSDKIICISDHIYQQVNAPCCKKELIYGGIDVDNCFNLHHKKNDDLKIALGLSFETSLVAQIGQITSWKNHFDFIKIAKEIIANYQINVHFLIIGDNMSDKENKYKEKLKTEIKKIGLEKHFSFLGFVNGIKDVYSQINVLIHPAIDEPFGRVVVEAMAMEKPVIAYDCGGPKEIILNDQTGFLVKPFDYKTIAEKLALLLNDKNLQLQFGKAGRMRAIEKFNITEQILKIEAVFYNI